MKSTKNEWYKIYFVGTGNIHAKLVAPTYNLIFDASENILRKIWRTMKQDVKELEQS